MRHDDDLRLPAKWKPLMRRLQRGQWTRAELRWLLIHHKDLPELMASEVRGKLAALDTTARSKGNQDEPSSNGTQANVPTP